MLIGSLRALAATSTVCIHVLGMSDGDYAIKPPWPAMSTDQGCIEAERPHFEKRWLHQQTIRKFGKVPVESKDARRDPRNPRICEMTCQDVRLALHHVNREVEDLSIFCPVGYICITRTRPVLREFQYKPVDGERTTQKGFCEAESGVTTLPTSRTQICAQVANMESSHIASELCVQETEIRTLVIPAVQTCAEVTIPESSRTVSVQAGIEAEANPFKKRKFEIDLNLPAPEEEPTLLLPVHLRLFNIDTQRTQSTGRQSQVLWDDVTDGHRYKACVELDPRLQAADSLVLRATFGHNRE